MQTVGLLSAHAAVQAALHPNQADAAVQAVLQPNHADAAVQVALHPNQAEAAVQAVLQHNCADADVRVPLLPNQADAPSVTFSRSAAHALVSQPNPVAVGQRVRLQDAVCHDPTFNRLVQEAKIREMEIARLERNRGFGLTPKNQRRPF